MRDGTSNRPSSRMSPTTWRSPRKRSSVRSLRSSRTYEDDAIRIANDSKYGLAGSVFTSDVSHGFELARRVRTGTFSVNSFSADFNSPFGGFKNSGIGREHGVAGLEGYLIPKTISVDPTIQLPADVVANADRITQGI
jgi:aldehyde dehydrogenase (NAD+)